MPHASSGTERAQQGTPPGGDHPRCLRTVRRARLRRDHDCRYRRGGRGLAPDRRDVFPVQAGHRAVPVQRRRDWPDRRDSRPAARRDGPRRFRSLAADQPGRAGRSRNVPACAPNVRGQSRPRRAAHSTDGSRGAGGRGHDRSRHRAAPPTPSLPAWRPPRPLRSPWRSSTPSPARTASRRSPPRCASSRPAPLRSDHGIGCRRILSPVPRASRARASRQGHG